jgi:hypothetical protein
MKSYYFLLIISFAFLMNSCGSVYKKHYDNGYTFMKHKKKPNQQIAVKSSDLQQKSLDIVSQEIKKEKEIEQKKSELSFQTYHKSLNKIENNGPARLISSINKISLRKISALKTDTIYRKLPAKGDINSQIVKKKSEAALVFALISIVTFWFLFVLSLIPAIIALVMIKKAEGIAKLNGESMPDNASAARIIAWVTIGLNILAILLIILWVLLVLILLGGI